MVRPTFDDGWTDLFVARDASPNLLLINQKDGTFRDVATDAEVAYDSAGVARAGMGVDSGDVNGDGKPDFAITNFNDQYHSLLVSTNSLLYEDQTVGSGLARFTKRFVGWGIHYIDFDNDGNLDLLVVNGHINQAIEATRMDVKYKEPPLLLGNKGKGIFEDLRERAGENFRKSYGARGLAIGDWNNDGGWTLYLPASMICLCYCGMILHRKIPGSVLSCRGRQVIEMQSAQRSRWKLREENGCDG
jgi:hypothetical protein